MGGVLRKKRRAELREARRAGAWQPFMFERPVSPKLSRPAYVVEYSVVSLGVLLSFFLFLRPRCSLLSLLFFSQGCCNLLSLVFFFFGSVHPLPPG